MRYKEHFQPISYILNGNLESSDIEDYDWTDTGSDTEEESGTEEESEKMGTLQSIEIDATFLHSLEKPKGCTRDFLFCV